MKKLTWKDEETSTVSLYGFTFINEELAQQCYDEHKACIDAFEGEHHIKLRIEGTSVTISSSDAKDFIEVLGEI